MNYASRSGAIVAARCNPKLGCSSAIPRYKPMQELFPGSRPDQIPEVFIHFIKLTPPLATTSFRRIKGSLLT